MEGLPPDKVRFRKGVLAHAVHHDDQLAGRTARGKTTGNPIANGPQPTKALRSVASTAPPSPGPASISPAGCSTSSSARATVARLGLITGHRAGDAALHYDQTGIEGRAWREDSMPERLAKHGFARNRFFLVARSALDAPSA